jgi:hypothetical protein
MKLFTDIKASTDGETCSADEVPRGYSAWVHKLRLFEKKGGDTKN